MSDLQVSLLIIGAIVVGGVTAFNWFQQWRLRRKLEHAFGEKHEDVLLREDALREQPQPERLEPQIAPAARAETPEPKTPPALPREIIPVQPDPPPRSAAGLPPVPGFDPAIDYLVSIDAVEPISAAGLAELHTRAAACGRRFRIAGYNAAVSTWEEAGRLSGGRYAHLRMALQLVNRGGPVESAALTAFCGAAQECAQHFAATASCPDVEASLAKAREVDAFCADVDVAIGINVVASSGKFSGTRIRSLAEAAGLKLESTGLFHYRDEEGRTLFTLDNHEPQPFLPEQIKHLSTGGMTLLLDVARVAGGHETLETMVDIGRELARELGGMLVDDNRVPLTDNSVRAIQQQLKAIHAKMEARGMPAGSERALRLFS
jgi:FtsZ-interacting cell division protein ZipA